MDLEQVLDDFMKENGLRSTQQRRSLLMSIFATDEHFTAEQLMDRLRQENSDASRSTVYRTLSLLVEAGLLREISLGAGQIHYDPNFNSNPDHAHLVCNDCGKVVEFGSSDLTRLINKLAAKYGYKVAGHMIKIEGICQDCQCQPEQENS